MEGQEKIAVRVRRMSGGQQVFTLADLARSRRVGRGRTWLAAARRCSPARNGREPLVFRVQGRPHPRLTELEPVLAWIGANPDFREREVYRRKGGNGKDVR